MRLEQLQYVVEIAKCRSMSKAAKQLFLSQPALSTAISNLETELGFAVFQRSFQGVALTEKGERLYKIASRVTQQLEMVRTISRDTEKTPAVNIAAVPAACNSLIIDLIHHLRRENPNAIINIQELRPIRVLQAIEDRTADICIGIYDPSIREDILKRVEMNDLQMEEVFHDTMCVYLSSGHPLAGKNVIYRHELENDTPIFFNDYINMDRPDTKPGEIQSNRNYFSFTDQASIKKAVAQGLGYVILPWQISVDDIYISSGQIVAIPLAGEDIRLTTFLAYRRAVALPPAEEQALTLLRQLYSQLRARQDKRARPSPGPENPTESRAGD